MGPVYVQYDKIERTVDRFQPQVIVCCAGGMTFTEEDAQKLKDRGIVLVGITLSDPDVFPTIRDHQLVFDLHTTNAEIALEMYREAGVENTVYFPFGIDRGFVTQEIANTDKFDADVICLGHATNRPDRNSMMSALAKKFDVKTYGRGWDIPDSQTVAGTEMVQALQGGKIHVNFPLTRAGYINIKCGVFESAGQARLVATGRFDEMSRFFTYGEDIIGYDDEEDLARQIGEILADPSEYERIALNGFRKVITEHLYEHRWMGLFDTLRRLGTEGASWLSAERRDQIETTLSQSLPRSKKVIVSGFYGARNLGDEMILRSISSSLMRADDAVQVYVASESPTQVEAAHGLQAFERKNHTVSAYQVKTASAVVLGGGGLWHDYTFARGGGLAAMFTGGTVSMAGFGILPLMGKVLDVPFHVVGLGVGPLTDETARKTVKYLASHADSIYVRDPESGEILRNLPVREELVHVGPDSVYAVDLTDVQAVVPPALQDLKDQGYTIVGLNLRPWAKEDMMAVAFNVRDAIVEVAGRLREQDKKLAVVALPMQAGQSMDRKAIGEVTRRLPSYIPSVFIDEAGELSLDAYIGALESCSVLVSMRLHAALISHRVGVPAVGLCYDPKVYRHFDEVGRTIDGLELTATPSEIADRVSVAISEGLSDAATQKVRTLEIEAANSLGHSVRAIAKTPAVPAVYEVPADGEAPTKKKSVATRQSAAHFAKMGATVEGIPGQTVRSDGPVRSGLHRLDLGMLMTSPAPGMKVEHVGVLALTEQKPTQIEFVLHSEYSNPRALGKLFIELEIGDYLFRHDLAASSEPVQLNFTTNGQKPVQVKFRVVAEAAAFRAKSWDRATNVSLEIIGTKHVQRARAESLIASAGDVASQGVG